VQEETGFYASRNKLQIGDTLLDSPGNAFKVDCAIGGGRRDEEKARAKERVFSHRDEFGQWDPKNQRPELWNLYNGRKRPGEHFRAFPISNWTEMDVWQYILLEKIPIPSIYFCHEREVFERDGVLYANSPFMRLKPEEKPFTKRVRFRTVGDMSCTGAVDSPASHPGGDHRGGGLPPAPPSAAPAWTTSAARPPWRTARNKATSKPHLSFYRISTAFPTWQTLPDT
jgi:sulfate adenylyltransferase subunit 2